MRVLEAQLCDDSNRWPVSVRVSGSCIDWRLALLIAAQTDRALGTCADTVCVVATPAHAPRARRYFFEIKRTFASIDPTLSHVKVPRNQRRVALRLRKGEPGVEWPALRSIDGGADWSV